jgi:hypothetical protein
MLAAPDQPTASPLHLADGPVEVGPLGEAEAEVRDPARVAWLSSGEPLCRSVTVSDAPGVRRKTISSPSLRSSSIPRDSPVEPERPVQVPNDEVDVREALGPDRHGIRSRPLAGSGSTMRESTGRPGPSGDMGSPRRSALKSPARDAVGMGPVRCRYGARAARLIQAPASPRRPDLVDARKDRSQEAALHGRSQGGLPNRLGQA